MDAEFGTYLKHAYKFSDEELPLRWAENVVWQYFSGMTFCESLQ
ncbi:hypothetical protein [Variovorax sp.]